jgi:hypothetical protein
MRLWSLHPKYLDQKGLTAVWREGLLAQKVLRGRTRGYRFHPQLIRFQESGKPISAINEYLRAVHAEAARRGYSFDKRKIGSTGRIARIPVARGQIQFEWNHLLAKLKTRDPEKCRKLRSVKRPTPHPLFRVTRGGCEEWEKGAGRRDSLGRPCPVR